MTTDRWKRTEELFHAARARPSGERDAFLAEACAHDAALRREIESLLDEPVSDDGFLAEPLRSAIALASAAAPDDMTGRALGGYVVESLIGVGGMGEVYRARDTTLGRTVAIKVLPPAFTSDPDRQARMEREARMLAAVNHPHICAIHGFEQADGIRFLVLELVEGETLAARLTGSSREDGEGRGLTQNEALAIARQVADALEFAHEKTIIHRDLKPANIKITPEGVVKVLDFGLAKAIDPEGPAHDLTEAPVTAADGVREGAVMGTAAYMSPEQACGKAVDRRTDIWAFGVVVFEMLAGRRPFAGETRSETLASVLKMDPDWSAVPTTLPADLRRLLRRCLEKDPRRRLQSIGDARVEIENLLAGPGTNADSPGPAPVLSNRAAVLPWIVSAVLALGLAAAVAWQFRSVPTPAKFRYVLQLPAGQTLSGSGGGQMIALSPDGARVAYVTTPYGLHVRELSDDEFRPVPGTETYEVRQPVFSPDGNSIVFFSIADRKLKKIAVAGGAAESLGDAATPSGISWNGDAIVFGQGARGIMRMPAAGGTAEQLVTVGPGESAHGPHVLPDGEHVLFTVATGSAQNRWDKAKIVVESLRSRRRTILVDGGSDGRYLPTGHVVYALEGMLCAQVLDLNGMKLRGERTFVVDGVRRGAGRFTGAANFSVSDNGHLVFIEGPGSEVSSLLDIAVMDPRTGAVEPLRLPPALYEMPRVSPKGGRIAFGTDDGQEAVVWYYELSGATRLQQLASGGNNRFPIWASETHVTYQSDRGGAPSLFWKAIGGAEDRLTTAEPGTSHAPESWSPDGSTLLYTISKGPDISLWTYSARDKTSVPFAGIHSSDPLGAVFSPDGRSVAYAVTERTRTTLYVRAYPDDGISHPLSSRVSDSPKQPRWSPAGTELFYNPRQTGFEMVRVTTRPAPAFGNPVDIPKKFLLGPTNSRTNYDVRSDGKLVGVVTSGQNEFLRGAEDRINVVLNWVEELKARVQR